MAVMTSINPSHCKLIRSGDKTVEVRTTRPKVDTPFKGYIYETKGQYIKFVKGAHTSYSYGCGKVIGEYICDTIYTILPRGSSFVIKDADTALTNQIAKRSCLYFSDLQKYLGNKVGYAWSLTNVKIYDTPKELHEFSRFGCITRGCACINSACDRYIDLGYNEPPMCAIDGCMLTRPPQSWCYVAEV